MNGSLHDEYGQARNVYGSDAWQSEVQTIDENCRNMRELHSGDVNLARQLLTRDALADLAVSGIFSDQILLDKDILGDPIAVDDGDELRAVINLLICLGANNCYQVISQNRRVAQVKFPLDAEINPNYPALASYYVEVFATFGCSARVWRDAIIKKYEEMGVSWDFYRWLVADSRDNPDPEASVVSRQTALDHVYVATLVACGEELG